MDQKTKQIHKKIRWLKNKLGHLEDRQLFYNGLNVMNLRKARTRTLIQLGGLIEKANLLEPLDVALGDDLQKDETCFDSIAILMGALAEIYPSLKNDCSQKILWQERGKKILRGAD